jgi:hypothetical protein
LSRDALYGYPILKNHATKKPINPEKITKIPDKYREFMTTFQNKPLLSSCSLVGFSWLRNRK